MKKKGIIITVILLVVAVVLTIVFINLFKEKDTRAVTNQVVACVDEGYLDTNKTDGEYEVVLTYLDNIISISGLSEEYKAEIANVRDLYSTFANIGRFYSQEIIFAQYNQSYQQYRNSTINALKDASTKANQLKNYIQENINKTAGANYWEIKTWDDCRVMAKEFVAYNIEAFKGLKNIYTKCLASKIVNNDFSALVLQTINTCYASAYENFSSNNLDVLKVIKMTETYLDFEHIKILHYIYDDELQTKVADIKEKETESEFYANLVAGTL